MGFAVGDRVRFKDAKTIRQLYYNKDILFGWNDEMYKLCGMEFTIKSIVDRCVYFVEDAPELHTPKTHPCDKWSISESMLEYPTDHTAEDEIIADDQLFQMLIC